MMSKNKKWFLALGVAAIMTVNGVVMAGVSTDKADASENKRTAATGKDFKHKRPHMANHTELLNLLKIDAETFKSELKSGKSLLTIAKDRGVSEKTLKSFMTKQMTERIDSGVKAGRLTADQAEKMKSGMEKRVSNMIKGEGHMQKGMKFRQHKFNNSAVLKLLNIDQDTLRQEMKGGKTLAAIAKERGVSEQTLKETIMNQMQQRIDAGVKAGKISADKAETIKANMEQRVGDMINGKGPMKHRR